MKNLNRHLMKTKNNQTQKLGGKKKMKAKKLILGLVALSILSFAASVSAEVPQMINYQGVLTDSLGCPLTGNYNMVFRIYDDSTDGTELWEDFLNAVPVTKGNFNVLLAIPGSLFVDTTELWLAVQVGNDPEMTPRQRITSVGYAFRAGMVAFDYDSKWFPISEGGTVTKTHGLGDDESKYIVFMDGKSSDGKIHHAAYGITCYGWAPEKCAGCEWYGLTNNEIKVHRAPDDADEGPDKDWYRCRIRIQKNQ